MAIHNRQDLHAFVPAGGADALAAALRRRKRCIDEALTLVDRAFLAQRIRQLRENLSQYLTLPPLLEPTMHRFVIGIALRQHVPLGAGVQNPQHAFQDGLCGHGLAPGARFSDVFLREMCPNPFPLIIA